MACSGGSGTPSLLSDLLSLRFEDAWEAGCQLVALNGQKSSMPPLLRRGLSSDSLASR